MKRKMLVGVVALVAAGMSAVPVGAHPGHASCAQFGATVSTNAQTERPWGAIVSQGAQAGLTAALTEEAHTSEGLCEPK